MAEVTMNGVSHAAPAAAPAGAHAEGQQ
ncbi:MAG TPA: cytochrome C oxidase subunit IV, partial [Afipia sp.]|nr:cytochrome C oxidase subunit IV [Afipia sp.]